MVSISIVKFENFQFIYSINLSYTKKRKKKQKTNKQTNYPTEKNHMQLASFIYSEEKMYISGN